MLAFSKKLFNILLKVLFVGAIIQLSMCADFPDSVKKLDNLVTANIFFWPGRNPEVVPPDPEYAGPACSCGKKNEAGSYMTQSAVNDNDEDGSSVASYSAYSRKPSPQKSARYKKGELLVKFRRGVSEIRSKSAIRSSGLALSDKLLARKKSSILRKIHINDSISMEKAMEELRKNPDVEYVQPNYIYSIKSIPDDYEFASQWGLRNTGQTINRVAGTPGIDINADAAWDTTTDCKGVVIAVLDTGVNYTHRDLADNMWDGSSCVDEAGNPLGGCVSGFDFVDNDKEPGDMNGHGTHVAGIIGARGNDGNRVTGVCWNAAIMSVRVLGVDGEGTTENIASGMHFAINNGAKVINASWGSPDYDQVVYDAISDVRDSGVLFIAAAGNYRNNNDKSALYPACFDLDNIISVAAINQNGELASFSSYGVLSVDIAAPGTNILSDYPAQIIDAYESFSSWKRGWGWEYEGYIDAFTHTLRGCLSNYNIRNNMDSYAYRIFDLTINNPVFIMLNFNIWSYNIQNGENFVHMVSDTGGNRPDNILFTLDGDNRDPIYDLTEFSTSKNISIGLKIEASNVIANEGLEIYRFWLSRWYNYNNATTCLFNNGTSMAAPFVSGVAGLVWSADTGLTYDQVKNKILNGARFNDNLTGRIAGSRMLDAAGALSAAP